MQIHLLGYSEATISRILDILAVQGYSEEITIVQNMRVQESIPFCPPGIKYKKISWDQWNFNPATQQCLPVQYTPSAKRKVVDFFRVNCFVDREHYFSLNHPVSVIASTANIGKGCIIEPGAVVASFANIGFCVYVNRGSTIGHHAIIEDFVSIGPGAHLGGHCSIGAGTRIGIGAVIFDHVRVGENTIIGGGSVVTKDIPANVVAWGNPCKVTKNIPVE